MSFLPDDLIKYLISMGVAAAAILVSWFSGRRSQKNKIKMERLEDEAEARSLRDEIDRDVADDPDPRQRLRDGGWVRGKKTDNP